MTPVSVQPKHADCWHACQGIETVRRDNCLLVRNVVTTSLEMILMQKDVTGAQAYVRATIADLLMNRMDLSLLVITKVLPSIQSHASCSCNCPAIALPITTVHGSSSFGHHQRMHVHHMAGST